MNNKVFLKFISFQILLIFYVSLALDVRSEEMLVRGKAKYLGWQIARDKFLVCPGNVISIGTGKVQVTNQRCRRILKTSQMVGTVNKVDKITGTFTFLDSNMKLHKFFFLETPLVRWKNLDDFKRLGEPVEVVAIIKDTSLARVIKITKRR